LRAVEAIGAKAWSNSIAPLALPSLKTSGRNARSTRPEGVEATSDTT
jgi:hypothetical protein